MLVQIQIRNIVLIDNLTIDFNRGLGVLTGETGAGKSILLDSLGLTLGMRAEASLVRAGADRAQVIAEFDVPPRHPVYSLLKELEIEVDEGSLLLKRSLTPDGRSRASICDQPVSVSTLRSVGELLVEMQGQFDQHGLLNPKSHIGSLDNFAGLADKSSTTAKAWSTWQKAKKALKTAEAEREEATANLERIRNDVEFLTALDPQEGEEAQLVEQKSLLSNIESIREGVAKSLELLEGGEGAETQLSLALRSLEKIADKAPDALGTALEALNQALIQTNESVACLQRVDLEGGTGSLEEIDDRIYALRDAARRFSTPVEDLAKFLEAQIALLADIEGEGASLEKLEAEAAKLKQTYVDKATALSTKRSGSAVRLDSAIMAELPPLKLERALFKTDVVRLEERDWSSTGMDSVQFLLAANPGAAPGPLQKVASGGELSRLLLAIKVVMSRVSPVPTLVFDEVDAGVGGATAAAIGQRLHGLARNLQILVVTHSPQVAARGDQHLRVSKSETDGKVSTTIVELKSGEREEEVARMLAGETVTPEARAAAVQLLEAK